MTDEVEVEYELRVADSEYARGLGMVGATCFKMTVPEGTPIDWDPPTPGGQMPSGLPEVELLADGQVVSRGLWPNLAAVA